MGDAPPVQIPMRVALPADIPTGAARLIKRLGVGWTHKALYARGPMLVARNDPHLRRRITQWIDVDSVSVRMGHPDGVRAVAIWINGRFEHAHAWTCCTAPDCQREGFEHGETTPTKLSAKEISVLVSDRPALHGFGYGRAA